jgi:hypothetical protein
MFPALLSEFGPLPNWVAHLENVSAKFVEKQEGNADMVKWKNLGAHNSTYTRDITLTWWTVKLLYPQIKLF